MELREYFMLAALQLTTEEQAEDNKLFMERLREAARLGDKRTLEELDTFAQFVAECGPEFARVTFPQLCRALLYLH